MDDIRLKVLHLPVYAWAQRQRHWNSLVPRKTKTAHQKEKPEGSSFIRDIPDPVNDG